MKHAFLSNLYPCLLYDPRSCDIIYYNAEAYYQAFKYEERPYAEEIARTFFARFNFRKTYKEAEMTPLEKYIWINKKRHEEVMREALYQKFTSNAHLGRALRHISESDIRQEISIQPIFREILVAIQRELIQEHRALLDAMD